jgi:peptidoglycan-associated lipoprotein
MKWSLAGLAAIACLEFHAAPVDACGIKLVIKTSTPRKAIARSSNPSHMLLLGTPPHRLERELTAAGHDVEVAPDPGAAKRNNYAVVVVDQKQADEARSKFATSVVVVRSGDVSADITSIESQVARRPIRTDESRTVVAARADRAPIAAGPTTATHQIVAAKEPGNNTQPDKEPTTTAVTATVPTPTPTPAIEQPTASRPATPPPPTPEAKHVDAAFREEMYFGLGSSAAHKGAFLTHAVKWISISADLHVVVEGYADPTGNHDANMALGQSRAESVRDLLVAAGVDSSRIEVISYGDTRLKYGHSDGRNRRVAIEPKK